MKTVVLSYRPGTMHEDEEVVLAGVPRVGEFFQKGNGSNDRTTYIVEGVLWRTATRRDPEPKVIVVVRPHVEGPSL